ncbi:MAG: T9SS type A sorting domain-containing protein [Chitinophagaceae bacterium]
MNSKSTFVKTAGTTLALAGYLVAIQPVMAAAKPAPYRISVSNGEEKPARKTKTKAKTFATLNNESVKIYPDPLKREMHVIAKENEGNTIDFYIFDVEGTLLHNYKMKNREHRRISGLARGTYVYRVFAGDEETAAGKFEIR